MEREDGNEEDINFIPHENVEEVFIMATPPGDENKNEEHEELVRRCVLFGMTFDSPQKA